MLAHSMGNWLLLESLRQMAIRDGSISPKIKNVLLAAPDVDVDLARQQIADMGPVKPAFALFVSRSDKALEVSKNLWGSSERLGAIDPLKEPFHSMLEHDRIAVYDPHGAEHAGRPQSFDLRHEPGDRRTDRQSACRGPGGGRNRTAVLGHDVHEGERRVLGSR